MTIELFEGDESVIVTLDSIAAGPADMVLGDAKTATVTIADDDIANPDGNVVVAINAGGPALTQDGINFAADTAFGNGGIYTDGLYDPDQPLFDGSIYETERYGGPSAPAPLGYSIQVDPGSYSVELHFAEIFQTEPGARVFDVMVEGQLVLDDFDILAETGGEATQPVVFTVPGSISPDSFGAADAIDISFEALSDNAKISGIVIRSVADAVPLAPLRLEAEMADTISGDYIGGFEAVSSASGGTVLSFFGGASGESGSASFVFGDSAGELPGIYNLALGTYDENDGMASFTVDLTDAETGVTTQIGSLLLDASLGSNVPTAQTAISPTIATGIRLTAGDIITVNGFEQAAEHARFDYLELVPTV